MCFQNAMHLIVTAAVVVLSLSSLAMISIAAPKEGLPGLGKWALAALIAMVAGPIGTAFLPKAVFGLFERLSTFSAVVFNAVLELYLYKGKLGSD